MNTLRLAAFVLSLFSVLLAQPVTAAMYKWVDESGKTHYGDRIPPQYANRANERLSKSGTVAVKAERPQTSTEVRPSEQEVEKQKLESKRQLEQRRQDTALLATYANESEIDLARERELRRNQDTLKMATAGLTKSNQPEDRLKLDSLMNLARQETDTINAKFDAQKVRFRELTGTPAVARAPEVKR